MLKVEIARIITATVKNRGLTQAEIGRIVGSIRPRCPLSRAGGSMAFRLSG
jgi:hypothetical protein